MTTHRQSSAGIVCENGLVWSKMCSPSVNPQNPGHVKCLGLVGSYQPGFVHQHGKETIPVGNKNEDHPYFQQTLSPLRTGERIRADN